MVRILAADGLDASAVHRLEERGYEVLQQHYEPESSTRQWQQAG